MAVRSKQLVAARVGNGATIMPIYTVPSGETTLLKSLAARNRSGAARVLKLTWRTSAGAGNQWFELAMAAGATHYVDLWLVMQEGDVLSQSGTAGDGTDSFFLWLSGSELEGVAD